MSNQADNPAKKNRDNLGQNIQSLFQDPPLPRETVAGYLEHLIQNLITTEKAIGSGFTKFTVLFIVFFLLDSGLVDKISISGTELQHSRVLLPLLPILLSFLSYQMSVRITFASELRTAIALLFKHAAPGIHAKGLDLLLHYPSVRNIESYHGKLVSDGGMRILNLWTDGVVLLLGFAPTLAVGYCVFRLFMDSTLSLWLCVLTTIVCAAFVVRTWVLSIWMTPTRNIEYYERHSQTNSSE